MRSYRGCTGIEALEAGFDRSIDIRISRIRRKIEPNPEKPEVIRTVRGIGYVYDPR
jgi:DNA-binding response OmpR family regulator